MSAILRAAAAYIILVFLARFGMQNLNGLVLIQQFGVLGAAGAMLTVTLLVGWFASLLFTRLFDVPAYSGPRLVMGIVALLVLIVAELRLGLRAGVTIGQYFAGFRNAPGLLDLAGQLAVALIPTIQIALRRKPMV